MKKIKINAYSLLEKIRKEKPVVHHLTNWVTIYDCANIVKALGASKRSITGRGSAGNFWYLS